MGIIRLMLSLLVFSVVEAAAGQFPVLEEMYLCPSVQHFRWQEETVPRLVRENGVMYGLGLGARLGFLHSDAGALTAALKEDLSGGNISYDGQSQDGAPIKTDVVYVGTKTEAALGWRFPLEVAAIEPFGALGYRWWLRSLQGDGGYEERWSSYFAKAGVRCGLDMNRDVKLFIEGGALYPFETANEVDFPGTGRVTVHPRGEWSGFAECGMRYGHLRAAVYYEGLRYGQSNSVAAFSTFEHRTINLFQPTSSADVFGVSLGWAFR